MWNAQTSSFIKLQGLDCNVPSVILHQQKGLSKAEQYARRVVYGYNKIAIPLQNVLTLLFLEMLNPFYVFQLFSVCLWFAYDYYYYAAVIVLMSAFGISMSIFQTRKVSQSTRNASSKKRLYLMTLKFLESTRTVQYGDEYRFG